MAKTIEAGGQALNDFDIEDAGIDDSDTIDDMREDFRKRGMVLEVMWDTRSRKGRQAVYMALVLGETAHQALLDEINRRRQNEYRAPSAGGALAEYLGTEEFEPIDFLPRQELLAHPLMRPKKNLADAVHNAEKAWQSYQEQPPQRMIPPPSMQASS